MANKDDYLTCYREFFENFSKTVNPNDQLPVKLASYKLIGVEVVGGIIDWTTQYLTQKNCPPHLFAPLIKIVIEEIRKACKKQPLLCGFNPGDNAYEPLKLMQTVMAKTNEVCLRYLDNSMLCSLPSPNATIFTTSVCAVRNSRRKMEDRHVVIHDLNTIFNNQEASPSSYFAVFDGHAGHDAAAYSAAHLHQFLAESLYFSSDPSRALYDAFCRTDELFVEKCRVENLSSGTTAVVALLRPKEKTLYVAWAGDSQALLVNQGKITQLVNPHKPNRPDERDRIERNGGCVMLFGTWRVNGQLAVSRAIGDADYKPHVTAIPDIREVPLTGNEDFIVLACDGLWDVLSEEFTAGTVYRLIQENPDDTDRISQHLVQQARDQGSTDNISVIVVFLRDPSRVAQGAAHFLQRLNTVNAENNNAGASATDAEAEAAMMEAGIDNANSAINEQSFLNGEEGNMPIKHHQKEAMDMFNEFTDNTKQNGTDNSPVMNLDFYEKEKLVGKRRFDERDDENDDDSDFGPEMEEDITDSTAPFKLDLSGKGFDSIFTPEDLDNKHSEDTQHNKIFTGDNENNKLFSGDGTFDKELINEQGEKLFERDVGNKMLSEGHIFETGPTQDNRLSEEEGKENKIVEGNQINKLTEEDGKMFGQDDNKTMKDTESGYNPFMLEMEKAEMETEGIKEVENIQKIEDDEMRMAREETPTPPADTVHDVGGLVDNVAESDSEDEWNYIKGEEADKENKPPESQKEVTGIQEDLEDDGLLVGTALEKRRTTEEEERNREALELDEMSSQLNPNAAEFVPVSPATSPVSGAPRLLDDDIISQSPKRPMKVDSVVSPEQFEKEVKSRPSELEDKLSSTGNGYSNDEHDANLSSELMENLLNGKNIDEIPEFQPHTPQKTRIQEEFHFGPNSTPFSPKQLDHSEALSTTAVFGDESALTTFGASFNDTSPAAKETDPMSASFHAARDDANPFDLNKVQVLPSDLDEFLSQPENSTLNDTISDLPEHDPLENKRENLIMNNDDAIQTTDLDKHNYDDEKELASPLETEKELFDTQCREDETDTPEPTNENLLGEDFCQVVEKSKGPETTFLPRDVELMSPEYRQESKSPMQQEATEVADLLQSRPENMPPDVELLPSETIGNTATEVNDLLGNNEYVCCLRPQSKSPVLESNKYESHHDSGCLRPESISPVLENTNPSNKEEEDEKVIKVVEIEPEEVVHKEEPQSDEDIDKATIVIGSEGVIEIEEEPSEYIPSPAAEPVDLEPQVIEPVSDLCGLKGQSPCLEPETSTSPDVNSFLNKSLTPESESLLPTSREPESIKDQKPVGEFEVKTDNISPQFAEQAFVATPSEESKHEDIPIVPLSYEATKELAPSPTVDQPPPPSDAGNHVAASAEAVAAVAAATVAAASATVAISETEDKKKVSGPAAKKSPASVKSASSTAIKTTSTTKSPASTAAGSKTSLGTRSSVQKPTGATLKQSLASTTVSKTVPGKLTSPKSRSTAPAKPTDKKPLANGDVKRAVKSTIPPRKPVTESTVTKTTTRPATARPATAVKTSTLTAPKPAPRPTTAAPKMTAPRPSSTTAAPKPKPVTATRSLTNPKTSSSATKTTTGSLTSKTLSSPTKPSSAATRPKPAATATAANVAPKPRVPLSRRLPAAAETDKQNKEAVNKATAAGRIAAASKTTSTTVKKVESKVAATSRTTVFKSTTTTMKSTMAKKPNELQASKTTKTTKVDKPKENGVATVVSEQITIDAVLSNTCESQLIKDNSPVDNKTIENTLVQVNATD